MSTAELKENGRISADALACLETEREVLVWTDARQSTSR